MKCKLIGLCSGQAWRGETGTYCDWIRYGYWVWHDGMGAGYDEGKLWLGLGAMTRSGKGISCGNNELR